MHSTPPSLLERLRQSDQESWQRFAKLYTPLLYYWARSQGLQESDAADLVQEVFVVVLRRLPQFVPEQRGSFRAWLKTVLVNKWRELQRRKRPQLGLDSNMAAAADDPALDESAYQQRILAQGLEIVRPEFTSNTWNAFQEHVVHGHSVEEVARNLGIRIGTVYSAKSKVLTRLRQELRGLVDCD